MTVAPAPATAPGRPGPGPTPDAVLRALDLTIRRRIDSLVAGEHRAPALGAGTELAQVRPYELGDDVRQIDWAVTARMREPHVRVHVAERTLTTWLLLDTSPSMTFGTADRRKADVAEVKLEKPRPLDCKVFLPATGSVVTSKCSEQSAR